ncbi:hypothetical protein KKF84_03930 [Myxococcota bacterium]|nr:hypothetical protein [Myxococcota bacterium]
MRRSFCLIFALSLLVLAPSCKKGSGGKTGSVKSEAPPVSVEADAAQQRQAKAALVKLQRGDFSGALAGAEEVLQKEAANPYALTIRAFIVAKGTIQGMMTTLVKMLDSGVSARAFQHADMRRVYKNADAMLEKVASDLAMAARSDKVHLELCLACWEVDWNNNGRIDRADRLLFQVEKDARGQKLPLESPLRKPTYRFDRGDLYWARAYVMFQRAAINGILAYDWSAIDTLAQRQREKAIKITLKDPKRMKLVRALVMQGLELSAKAREAYLAETDDDREWVPSPRQKSHPMPMAVDARLYQTWGDILGDLQRLLGGKEGLSAAEITTLFHPKWKTFPGGFIDLGAMFQNPKDFTLHLPTIMAWLEFRPRHGMGELERLLGAIFGRYYKKTMKPSPLTGRLKRMKDELSRGEETFEQKLGYLIWIN